MHSVTRDTYDDEPGGLSEIKIDMLMSGIWDDTLVTYDSPVQSLQSFSAGSFSVEGYPYDTAWLSLQQMHEVDVTQALGNPSFLMKEQISVTFKLYSDENLPTGRVDFASKEWNGGFAKPELVIELSDSPPSTTSPTVGQTTSTSVTSTIPSTSSTSTTIPTTSPTISPCIANCDVEASKKYLKEFNDFDSIDAWVANCQSQPECVGNERRCKKECPLQAQKAAEKATKKSEEHEAKCKEKCLAANAVAVDHVRTSDNEMIDLMNFDP